MKTYGDWSYNSNILDLDTRRRTVVSFTLRLLYHRGKSSQYALDRLVVAPEAILTLWKRKKEIFPPLPGIETRPSNPIYIQP
jgi:hypothetical protein